MIARRRLLSMGLVAGSLAALRGPRSAHGEPSAPRLEILVLYARKDPGAGHVDPRVPKLPQLAHPPFDAYNTYELVDRAALPMDPRKVEPFQGKPGATYVLVTGKPLHIALLQRVERRFEMGAVLGTGAPDRLRWSAPPDEPFFLAGQSYRDGILVIGITVRLTG